MSHGLTLRPFRDLEEYRACARFQEEVWGEGFSETVSPAILMIANRLGGLAAGAFDQEGDLHGFVFGLTGVEEGEIVHWSDMLAVRPGERDRGLGTRLKHYQREVLLGRGIRRMRWTFDPLQGRNAHVNFAKLGIHTREYQTNLYGETDSPLHRGVGTDRLVACWPMDAERVVRRMKGQERGPRWEEIQGLPRIISGPLATPTAPDLDCAEPRLLLPVPEDLDRMMAQDMELAIRWREVTREAFLHYFDDGYVAREFIRGPSLSHYFLVREGEKGAGAREPESGPAPSSTAL